MVVIYTDFADTDYAEGFAVPWSCSAGAVCHEAGRFIGFIFVSDDDLAGSTDVARISEFIS